MIVITSRRTSIRAGRREVTEITAAELSHGRTEPGCVTGPIPPRDGLFRRVGSLRAERLQEEQDQRNHEDVNRERLDEDEAEEQDTADIAGGPGVAGNALGGRRDRATLAKG